MASRRTRIKGIANIPQRRKNVSSEEKNDVDNNLTKQPDKEIVEQPLREPVNKSDTACDLSVPEEELDFKGTQDVTTVNDSNIVASLDTKDEIIKTASEKEVPNKKLEEENIVPQAVQPPKPLIKRRTFIKPSVSASAINRKPKQNVEKVESETVVEKTVAEASKIEATEKIQQIYIANDPKEKQTSKEVCTVGGEVTLDEIHLTSQNGVPESEISSDKGVRKVLPHPSNNPSSDTEYPPPPPSPSKINRSRIKAIPRLSYRKTSFSASESEDESKRHYNRNRNDSVCSTASGAPESIADCLSPQRPKDFTLIAQKKCNRTEQSRKLAEARREFQRRFGTNKPDRQRLTMIDLIFYNPTSNPMTSDTKSKPEKETEDTEPNQPEIEAEKVDDPQVENTEAAGKSDEENEVPVPQIKISASGEIIIDEQSLVIESKEVKKQREELQKTKLVDGDYDTGYGIYKRQRRAKEWTSQETLRFYKALNTIGTDFTLMCELFPRRTRRELKQKFKKEERTNRSLIDKAVMQPCSFDYVELKHEVDMEEKEMAELQVQKEKEAKLRQEKMEERQARKRKAMEKVEAEQNSETPAPEPPADPKPPKLRKIRKPRTKKFNIESVLEDSDADVSDIATQSESEGEEEILTPLKPTRSGRMPKTTKKFDTAEACSVENIMKKNKISNAENDNIEPGSIMIITEAGPNGEPVHKIYMVTSDNSTTPLNLNSEAVSKAIQFKKGVLAQNIVTISANTTDNEAGKETEENNITIPADENVMTLKGCNGGVETENTDGDLAILKLENGEVK